MVDRRRKFSCWLKLPLQLHAAETSRKGQRKEWLLPSQQSKHRDMVCRKAIPPRNWSFPWEKCWKTLLVLCISPTFFHPIQRLSLTVTSPEQSFRPAGEQRDWVYSPFRLILRNGDSRMKGHLLPIPTCHKLGW